MNQEDVLVLLVVFVLGFVVSQMMSGRLVEGDYYRHERSKDIATLNNVSIKTKDGEKLYTVTQTIDGDWPYSDYAKITIQDQYSNYLQFTNQNNKTIDVNNLDCGNFFFGANRNKVKLNLIDHCIACLSRDGTVGFTKEEVKDLSYTARENKFCKIGNKWYNQSELNKLKSNESLPNEVHIITTN